MAIQCEVEETAFHAWSRVLCGGRSLKKVFHLGKQKTTWLK